MDAEPIHWSSVQHGHVLGVGVLALIAVVVAGCSAPGDDQAGDPVVAALAEHQLALPNVPDGVVTVLERIRDAGDVTFQDYQEAAQLWVACVEPLGISATLVPVKAYGLQVLSTSEQFPSGLEVGDPEEAALREASQSCRNTWWSPVEMVYLTSPRSLEVLDASIEPYREQILACLAEVGKPLAPDATRDELTQAAVEISMAGGRDCVEEAGYDGS